MSQTPRRKSGGFRQLLSWVMFAISGALLVLVAISLITGDALVIKHDFIVPYPWIESNSQAPVPTIAGKNEMINVKKALEDQGLKVDFARGPGAQSERLKPAAGQALSVNGTTVYVFIYESVAAQEKASKGLTSENVGLNNRGTPVTTEPVHVYSGSNVIVVLVGGDDATQAKVKAAITKLP